jgi:hypothetical protein
MPALTSANNDKWPLKSPSIELLAKIKNLLPYEEINVSDRMHESVICHLICSNTSIEIALKNHFDQLVSEGVKLSDIYVSNIDVPVPCHYKIFEFNIEYAIINPIIVSNNDIIIKPLTPGRRTVIISKDGTCDIVSDPTTKELTETIKVLASKFIDLYKKDLHRRMDESAIAASMEFQKQINDWETVKKELNINDKQKKFPLSNGIANEMIWHQTNGFNRNIRVFSLKYRLNDNVIKDDIIKDGYMILTPFTYKKNNTKKFLFKEVDGEWKIDINKKLQVLWYKNELIAIISQEITSNNGRAHFGTDLSFYKAIYIKFQDGSMKENGVNGITNEVLLSILINRFDDINRNDNDDDKKILELLQSARLWMYKRTLDKHISEYNLDGASNKLEKQNCPCKTIPPHEYKEYEKRYGECSCKYVRKLKIGDKFENGKCVWEITDFGIANDGYTPTYKVINEFRICGEEYAKTVDELCGKI